MSVTLTLVEALGVIGKLLPQLKSFTGARRREYFDRLVLPLHESLKAVHTSYDALFLSTKEAAVALLAKAGIGPEEAWRSELNTIVESFRALRQTDESLRDSVRRSAQESLAAITWPQERRFYFAAAYYFLRAWPTPLAEEQIDLEVAHLIESGGNEVWPTPSTIIYSRLRDASTPTEVINLLDSARNDLIARWTQVSVRYRAVVTALVMET